MPSAWSGLLHERGSIGEVDVADRPGRRAVGGQRDHGAVVVALDEAGADHLGDDHGRWHERRQASAAACWQDAARADPARAAALPDAGGARRPRAAGQRGARRPDGFNQPGSPVTLTLPEPVAAQARAVGRGRAGRPRGAAAGPGRVAGRRRSTRSRTRSTARSAT